MQDNYVDMQAINVNMQDIYVWHARSYAVHENLLFFPMQFIWPVNTGQNAIQYLYLHLFTTKFVAILLTLTQKCHISQSSNVQKVRHLEQSADGWRTEQSRRMIQYIIRTKDWYFSSLIILNTTATSYFFTNVHAIYFWNGHRERHSSHWHLQLHSLSRTI